MDVIDHTSRWMYLLMLSFISKAVGQDLEVVTKICNRVRGQSIRIQASYPNNPSGSVTWDRPGSPTPEFVGSCRPTVSCAKPPGYTLSYVGFNYSIAFDNATVSEHVGIWTVSDATYRPISTRLDLSENLALKTVTCNASTAVMVNTGSSQSVTCSTGCLDQSLTNATLSFVLANSTEMGIETTQSCAGAKFGSTNTITLDTTIGLTGNKSLCYKLTSGQCSFTQQDPDCITVVFPLDLECASGTGLTVVVAFGATLVIISVGILIGFVLFVMKKENGKEQNSERDSDSKRKSHRKKGKCVAALLVAALICFILVVCLIGYALGSNTGECEPFLYAGIALLIIGIIILIVAAVIYVKCFRGSIEETRNDTNLKKIKHPAPPEG